MKTAKGWGPDQMHKVVPTPKAGSRGGGAMRPLIASPLPQLPPEMAVFEKHASVHLSGGGLAQPWFSVVESARALQFIEPHSVPPRAM